MPHFYKTLWQYVHGKSPYKLAMCQGHQLLLCLCFVVFVGKSYRIAVYRFEPVVADSNLVRISAKVFYHRFGVAKWSLGIYHPIFAE